MEFKKHCEICSNRKVDLQNGIVCNLTNKKPHFKETCSDIKFSQGFYEKLGLIHVRLEVLKKKKTTTYIYSGVFTIIGVPLMLSQRDFLVDFNLTYSRYLELTRSLLIILLGFLLISKAYKKINKHRKMVKTTKDEKKSLDNVLQKYQIEYIASIEFGRKYLGIQDIVVGLKSESDLFINSRAKYQI